MRTLLKALGDWLCAHSHVARGKQNLLSLWIPLLSRGKGLTRNMLDLHQTPLKCYIPLGLAMLRKHAADSCGDLL